MPTDINYLAVLVAAIVTFALGALWYSLLFGKQWAAQHGYSEEKLAEMQKDAPKSYIGSFIAYLVMAFAFAVLVSWTGVATAAAGAGLGFLLWVGFVATTGLTTHLFSDKAIGTYLIDVAYQLVYLLVMGVILAVWR